MKRGLATLFVLLLCAALSGCFLIGKAPTAKASSLPSPSTAAQSSEPTAAATASPQASPKATASATAAPPTEAPASATPAPTPTPKPTPAPFAADVPDKAGEKGIRFDIYKSKAAADLNGDGTPEQIVFTAGKASAVLAINGVKYTIKKSGLAQLVAITDVDTKDKNLEIVLTQKYDSGLADSEKAYSWLYWWDGKALTAMGGLMDVKFDGLWRKAFHPAAIFDGAGQVTCLARTTELTDVWYMAHYKPSAAKRTLQEAPYTAKIINEQGPLKVKTCCLLLKKITTKYFKPAYYSMYDPASWPHSDIRVPDPAMKLDFTLIAQKGETLQLVAVYGQNWFKLKSSDGYQGWIKVVGGKVQGYWQVMKWTANDIFDGIVVAG